jgi:hypothetical protein
MGRSPVEVFSCGKGVADESAVQTGGGRGQTRPDPDDVDEAFARGKERRDCWRSHSDKFWQLVQTLAANL